MCVLGWDCSSARNIPLMCYDIHMESDLPSPFLGGEFNTYRYFIRSIYLLLHYCGLLVPACFLENLHCQFHSFSGLLRRARHHLPVVHVDGRPDPSVVTCADNLAGV